MLVSQNIPGGLVMNNHKPFLSFLVPQKTRTKTHHRTWRQWRSWESRWPLWWRSCANMMGMLTSRSQMEPDAIISSIIITFPTNESKMYFSESSLMNMVKRSRWMWWWSQSFLILVRRSPGSVCLLAITTSLLEYVFWCFGVHNLLDKHLILASETNNHHGHLRGTISLGWSVGLLLQDDLSMLNFEPHLLGCL